MTAELDAAIQRVSEVVMFENWLRFYFIVEENDKLFMRLPDKAMEQIRQRYTTYVDLAEMLNNEEIDHQRSLKTVCLFVSSGIDGRPLSDFMLAEVFDNPQFQVELQLFSNWVQSYEDKLDERFMEFSEWQQSYNLWKATDEVKNYSKRLAESMTLSAPNASETLQ